VRSFIFDSNPKLPYGRPFNMKTMYRIWWFILGIGITVLGGYLTAVDPTMRVTGVIAIVVGMAVACVMGYVLFKESRR